LIGGYAGSAVAKAGWQVIIPAGWTKTLLFIVLSPVIGMILGLSLMIMMQWAFRDTAPSRVDRYFRRLQLLSAALFSLGHGTNDAQKTMGIIAGVLFTAGYLKTFEIPFWVILMAHAAIGLGTLSGGWRIVRTMGQKITALRPLGGFSAETAGAISIIGAAWSGIPVSTTHTITGAIVGVGATRRLTAVKWGVTRRIVWAWIITIPAASGIGALAYTFIR
jgi:PiT family inorganic phosphate transporter